MAVSEDDVKQEEIIQDDFRIAKDIMGRIRKEFGVGKFNEAIIFTLCLIYARQLKHHKHEESMGN